MTLAQWVSGQLHNMTQTEDPVTLRQVLRQVTLAARDAVSIPWPAVCGAWALSMTQVEEGQLKWPDTTQWALNRINSLQVAVLDLSSVSNTRTRICKFYNEESCAKESHHGQSRHFCAVCYRQGKSLSHPESKCTSKLTPRTSETRTANFKKGPG